MPRAILRQNSIVRSYNRERTGKRAVCDRVVERRSHRFDQRRFARYLRKREGQHEQGWENSVKAHTRLVLVLAAACCSLPPAVRRLDAQRMQESVPGKVKPGITVLLEKRIGLIQHRRIALVTNQAGQDEKGRSDIDLLRSDPRAVNSGVRLVALFAPEHGIRGTEDRANVENGVDAASGLVVHSLFGAQT